MQMSLQKFMMTVICFCSMTIVQATDQELIFFSNLDVRQVFRLNAGRGGGIIADVSSGGQVDVKVFQDDPGAIDRKGALLYEVFSNSTTTNFQGSARSYNRSELGWGAHYYPAVWTSTDISASTLGVDLLTYNDNGRRKFTPLNATIPVVIEIIVTQATFHSAKVPGIGIIDNSKTGILFKPSHFCANPANKDQEPCRTWIKVKSPDLIANADLVLALHRGHWGFDLGTGYPENSRLAIERSVDFSRMAETDVTITSDNKLVVSHDFSLKRISNSTIANSYTFNQTLAQLQALKLKHRNGTVSTAHYLSFSQLIDLAKEHRVLIMVDIKGLQPKIENGTCVLNCQYSDLQKQKESWLKIFGLCMDVVIEEEAMAYVAFKTPYLFDDLKTEIPRLDLEKVLYMPVVQPSRTDFVAFVDDWHLKGGRAVVAYETNFLNATHPILAPITKHGTTYDNLMHYVYDNTRLRGGSFSPEPNGPRGVSFRWNNWFMKSPTDFRGDPMNLINVPFGEIMMITTDRPEVWTAINNQLNQ